MPIQEDADGIDVLLSLDPQGFEAIVADWLTSIGWFPKTTLRSHDGGVDVVAFNPDALAGGKYVVQCKRYARGNVVGSAAVREFYGVVHHEDAVRGLFVTTSSFSRDARQFAEGKRITLLDGAALCAALSASGLLNASEDECEPCGGAPMLDDALDYASGLIDDDPVAAEQAYVRFARTHSDCPAVWLGLGDVRFAMGRWKTCVENYRHALSLSCQGFERRHALVSIGTGLLLQSHDLRAAERERCLDESEAHLLKAASEGLGIRPEAHSWLFTLYLRRFSFLHRQDDCVRAARQYRLLTIVSSLHLGGDGWSFIGSSCEERLEEWLDEPDERGGRANCFNWDRALEFLDAEARTAASEGAKAYAASLWDQAVMSYEVACAADPDDSQHWALLGSLYVRLKRHREASRAYTMYIGLKPEAADAAAVSDYLDQVASRLSD